MNKFRPLRPDEIECRVGSVKPPDANGPGGVSLLLYKDARCDMNILDETVGPDNWQRHHSRDNANCTVSIFSEQRGEWIEKEDTGTESNTEAQKGLASDSFKRACFNWGIGRELYTAPFIWVGGDDCRIKERRCLDSFTVRKIEYDEAGTIIGLIISNDKSRKFVYTFGTCKEPYAPQKTQERPQEAAQTAQAAPDGNFYCIDCGGQIGPVTSPEGITYGPAKVLNRALKKYHCQLCWNCQMKRDESKSV